MKICFRLITRSAMFGMTKLLFAYTNPKKEYLPIKLQQITVNYTELFPKPLQLNKLYMLKFRQKNNFII